MSRREKVLRLRDGQPKVLPSMLLCDFAHLAEEVARLEAAGFQGLHLDVMDGVFVPNFSYGMTIVQAFRRATDLPLDVHLMMTRPERYLQQFHDAGADSITFHVEAVEDPRATVQSIHDLGMAAGVAIDRDTPASAVADLMPICDVVLVMTIKAGFGGQTFIPVLLQKLGELQALPGPHPVWQVDGGVNASTIGQCVDAGADWMVVGSGIFRHEDYQQAHEQLMAHMCSDKR
jgi:ribulose-phosphate 3-epimerase